MSISNTYQQLIDYLETLYNKDFVEFQDYINIESITNQPIERVKQFFSDWMHNEKYSKLIQEVIETKNW